MVVTGIVGFLFEPRKPGETGVPNPSLKSLPNAELNLLFKISYPKSNFALTLGYLNRALNTPAQSVYTHVAKVYVHLLELKKAFT